MLCIGADVDFCVLLTPHVCFRILVVFVWPPTGKNSCSFGLRYAFLVIVPDC